MLGVPLLVGDNLIGVLHVGRLGKRLFTTADAELLELVAERVAFATQTRLLQVERAASRLLERSLLPRRSPTATGSSRGSLHRRQWPRRGRRLVRPVRTPFWRVVGDHRRRRRPRPSRRRDHGPTPQHHAGLRPPRPVVRRRDRPHQPQADALRIRGNRHRPVCHLDAPLHGLPRFLGRTSPAHHPIPGQPNQVVEVNPVPPLGAGMRSRPRLPRSTSLPARCWCATPTGLSNAETKVSMPVSNG